MSISTEDKIVRGADIAVIGAAVRTAIDNATVPVVDDLTTGGTTKALSAEQGKVIKASLDSALYFGETVGDPIPEN